MLCDTRKIDILVVDDDAAQFGRFSGRLSQWAYESLCGEWTYHHA